MIFNSIDFGIFLPIVFILYWFVFNKNTTVQNFFLLIASYIFYGWWDYSFLGLIAFSTIADFIIGKRLGVTFNKKHRRFLVWLSLSINLGLLGYFKYCNFFIESFVEAFSLMGYRLDGSMLNIILPVGISFLS